ncbi:MAG: hypothetical protein QM790_10840 [Nibricoccus sp.]
MADLADRNPVAVTACECITPFGDASGTCATLLRGEKALKPVPVLGKDGGDPVPIALLPGRVIDETSPPSWGPAVKKLLAKVAGSKWGSVRRPILFTSSNFGVGNLYAYCSTKDKAHLAYGAPHVCVDWLRREMGWGENFAIFSHACVSAHLGLVHAERVVQAGLADEALVVTFDFISPFVAGGFHALKILNTDFPAPYMSRETGSIGLGDGAAYAIISREGAGPKILGQSLHNEMFHFTANQPDGSGFQACIAPLSEKTKGRRLWIKGHGTGTLEAGRLESTSLASAFPDAPLVGWKGSLGHTLGSCGLVELAIVVETLKSGRTPGTVGTTQPTFTANVATDAFSSREFDSVLCTSNAFGGAHAALLLAYD